MATYKAVMKPALEYASSIWSPLASSASINKLQVMQNTALRTATGCTQDTNIQHLHDETLILPIHEHLQLHASQYKQKTQHPPLTQTYNILQHSKAKNTIFSNGRYTTNIPTDPHTISTTAVKTNMHHIHTFLKSYLHKVDAKSHPSPLCPLCNTHTRHTSSLQLHPHTHHIVTPGFVDRPRRSDCTAGRSA